MNNIHTTRSMICIAVIGFIVSLFTSCGYGLSILYDEEKSKFTSTTHYIYTADDLNAVRGGVAGYDDWELGDNYIVMADIDLSDYAPGTVLGGTTGWTPIGNFSAPEPFTGTLDGNNFTISNLSIDNETGDYQALFGYTDNAVIKNLNLTGCSVTGEGHIGCLVAYQYGGVIENCNVSGSVSGTTAAFVGGITGKTDGAEIHNCSSAVDVDNASATAGGIAGGIINSSIITNCHATGDVNGTDNIGGITGYMIDSSMENCYSTGDVDGESFVGGLIGFLWGSLAVKTCYATGDVAGESMTGGLIGQSAESTIRDCYATGDVTSIGNAGGLIGQSASGTTISDCYATGDVAGESMTGGLIGQSAGSTIKDCYATGDVTSIGNAGGLIGKNGFSGTITNCYSRGNAIRSSGTATTFGGFAGINSGDIDGAYYCGDIPAGLLDNLFGERRTAYQMKLIDMSVLTYDGWDFSSIWEIDPTKNQNFPYLLSNPGP